MIAPRIYHIISLLIVSSQGEFSSSHICPREVNYTVTSMEIYTEPVVVNTFTWCLQVPPRCPNTRTEMRQRHRIKTETKTKIVNECCEGYGSSSIEDDHKGGETSGECLPICKNCNTEFCIAPNVCNCTPGTFGYDCSLPCPPRTWGHMCRNNCNCSDNTICDPVNGVCNCPPGFHGQKCDKPCSKDRWGTRCIFSCNCKNSSDRCNPETGECIEIHDSTGNVSLVYPENSPENHRDAPSSTNGEYSEEYAKVSTTIGHTTEGTSSTTYYPSKGTNPETTRSLSTESSEIKMQTRGYETSSTSRPVIVLVSVPERRRNLEHELPKFSMKNPFMRHIDDNDLPSPKTDYVKTIRKDKFLPKDDVHTTPIPLDVALIIVASIVSLGLTSVAVVMVLHMRSKLFEAGRISMYDEAKAKGQELENIGTGRISILGGGLPPQTPIRVGPLFSTSPETNAFLTLDTSRTSNGYANGATLGLRISGNIHELLQDDHYDRPPATLIRLQTNHEENMEHVYDEIPLQSTPLNTRKNA